MHAAFNEYICRHIAFALYRCDIMRVGTYLYKAGITAIAHFIVSDVIGPHNGVRCVFSTNKLRRDASRVCTARIARVYLHRNGTRKGLYILLDVSSGRERRDKDDYELIKQNSRTVSLSSSICCFKHNECNIFPCYR